MIQKNHAYSGIVDTVEMATNADSLTQKYPLASIRMIVMNWVMNKEAWTHCIFASRQNHHLKILRPGATRKPSLKT